MSKSEDQTFLLPEAKDGSNINITQPEEKSMPGNTGFFVRDDQILIVYWRLYTIRSGDNMKMTFNRRLILLVLSEHIECRPPPHSASSVSYALETAFTCKWDGLFEAMQSVPNKQQIHRTLRELWHGGLIVGRRVKQDWNQDCLPCWVIEYQLSGDVYRNWLTAECDEVYRKVQKAKHGVNLFGGVFDMGLPESEVKPLMLRVKVLIQKTHPDKAEGYGAEFMQMKQCSDWIKSGIPLPTPTHQAGENVALKLTLPK